MRSVLRQIWRGMGYLPCVGSHPGNIYMIAMSGAGAIAGGGQGGLPGVFVGVLIMWIGLGPFYLYGCYSRAKMSDAIMLRKGS